MYVEAKDQGAVESWVTVVRKLRYKDFQLATRPGPLHDENQTELRDQQQLPQTKMRDIKAGVSEVETVKEFGSLMEQRGVWKWWRKGMGYVG